MTEVSLAWLLTKVTAPVVGATKFHHIEGAAKAVDPCPLIVVGAMVEGKPTWTLVAHAGTVAHSHLMVSLVQAHYINKGIRENKRLSVNVVDTSWLKAADCMGTISGNKVDKSDAFQWTMGENGAPLIDDAKVSIECEVDGNYELEHFGVLMAATIGVPLYMCGGGTIPLLQQWLVDGMSMGSAAAFMITGRRGARIFDSTVCGFSLCEKL